MCKKNNPRRIDPCMRYVIKALESSDHKPQACCCGHGRYPMTIVVNSYGLIFELMSGKAIPRITRFYRKDAKGFYYIPEVCKEAKDP